MSDEQPDGASTEVEAPPRASLTPRRIVFGILAILYIVVAVLGISWQLRVTGGVGGYGGAANFSAAPVPVTSVLSQLPSYKPADQGKPVKATGLYLVNGQRYVADRRCHGEAGFEVLTPLELASGSLFIIDRGCEKANSANPSTPPVAPAPPEGQVTVTARLVASEQPRSGVTVTGNTVASIALPALAKELGGPVYTGAYGLLETEKPAAAHNLRRVLTAKPAQSPGAVWAFIVGDILYAAVGILLVWLWVRGRART